MPRLLLNWTLSTLKTLWHVKLCKVYTITRVIMKFLRVANSADKDLSCLQVREQKCIAIFCWKLTFYQSLWNCSPAPNTHTSFENCAIDLLKSSYLSISARQGNELLRSKVTVSVNIFFKPFYSKYAPKNTHTNAWSLVCVSSSRT